MGYTKRKAMLILLTTLTAVVAVSSLLSALSAKAASPTSNRTADDSPAALRRYEKVTTFQADLDPTVAWNDQAPRNDAQACTFAVATGDSTVDGRPVLWKNRDYFGRPDT